MKSKQFAKIVRRSILDMVHKARAAHIGSCFSCVDILSVLYSEILRKNHEVSESGDLHKDYVLVSKGHASAAVYATLAHAGYFSTDELQTYSENGSRLAGHVTKTVPGVTLSTGALGHALSVGCGIALAQKDKFVYVVMSDGECDEGSVWEAAMFAGFHKLKNLKVIIDYNKIQSFGKVEDILSLEPLADKWEAFNWAAISVNGHDHGSLSEVLSKKLDQPSVIIANTIKGKGVSFMENNNKWHYTPTSDQEYKLACSEIENAK